MSDNLKWERTESYDYIKVDPCNNSDLEEMEKEIKRHVDYVNSTEIVYGEILKYKDEESGNIEEDSLYKVCRELAYQKDLIKDNMWTTEYDANNVHHKFRTYDFDDILWNIVNYGAVITSGELTDEQSIIVKMANEIRKNRYKNIED